MYPPHFPESGITDDRWYNWRVANWDTKWDACDVDIEEERCGDELEGFTSRTLKPRGHHPKQSVMP